MQNLVQLAKFIRFQLAQLKPENKHHDFEHLARWYARKRICEHILAATGPVGAGGDQGRDFETYRTYLSSAGLADSSFLGVAPHKKLVFACSLQTKIEAKIRADVTTICSGPTTVDDIYFFAEADIAVSHRHTLQTWALEKHSVRLEILDGQTLAEELTNPDIFWIAEEFLAVSAEHYPQTEGGDELYAQYRARWIGGSVPRNYADFFEVKYGLRKATFSTPHKPDLTTWMKIIGSFLDPSTPAQLHRRAIYEICVAALRGQNNLDAKADLISQYFANLEHLEVDELTDTITLLFYCSGAHMRGHFQIAPDQLHDWTVEIWKLLKAALSKAPGPGSRCSVLQQLGHAGLLPYRKGSTPEMDMGDTFRYWKMLLKVVHKAPMFPLEDFADQLTAIIPIAGKDARFLDVTSRVDELLSSRTSGFVAAEKCRDRAVKYLESDQYIPAIKQFHSARVQWFAAETLKGSLLSMLMLAKCYRDLGLAFAGAYYALGAALVAFRSEDEGVKHLFPRAIFMAADCYYSTGATLTYLQILQVAFLAHGTYSKDPGDLEVHEDFQDVIVHCAIVKGIAERLQPELVPVIDEQISQWPIADDFKEDIREWSSKPDIWTKTDPIDKTWCRAQQDLLDRPFSDLGSPRNIVWRALGLIWGVEHQNTFHETLIAEEFVATLQIIVADLADVDLCLLPMSIRVTVSLRSGIHFHVEDIPNNTVAVMKIDFPKVWVGSQQHLMEMRAEIVSVATAVLRRCSCLEDKEFLALVENSFKTGLAGKAFSVRPYAELYSEFISSEMFAQVDRAAHQPLNNTVAFEHPEHEALRWPSTPGPGYSEKNSIRDIINRYDKAIKPIGLTLPILMRNAGFAEKIQKLRTKGYKDWHVLVMLANIAAQYRVEQKYGKMTDPKRSMVAMKEEISRDEKPEDIPVPPTVFTDERMEMQEKVLWITFAKTLGLRPKGATPNFVAIETLLVTRYRIFRDDVPHADFFPGA